MTEQKISKKQLLIDYFPFEITPEQINESLKTNDGKLIVRGILQRADAKNYNQRIYPREILEREAKKYIDNNVKERRAIGELDHADSQVVNLQNVSHNIIEMHWKGDDLIGTLEVLSTPAGNILKELFKSGIQVGISSRGLGSVKNLDEKGTVEVQDDYEILCWDAVSAPSTAGAYIAPINESITTKKEGNYKYDKVNEIIREIICGSGNNTYYKPRKQHIL